MSNRRFLNTFAFCDSFFFLINCFEIIIDSLTGSCEVVQRDPCLILYTCSVAIFITRELALENYCSLHSLFRFQQFMCMWLSDVLPHLYTGVPVATVGTQNHSITPGKTALSCVAHTPPISFCYLDNVYGIIQYVTIRHWLFFHSIWTTAGINSLSLCVARLYFTVWMDCGWFNLQGDIGVVSCSFWLLHIELLGMFMCSLYVDIHFCYSEVNANLHLLGCLLFFFF